MLKAAALGTAGAALPGAARDASAVPESAAAPYTQETPPFEFEEVTISELQAGLERGRWTALSADS